MSMERPILAFIHCHASILLTVVFFVSNLSAAELHEITDADALAALREEGGVSGDTLVLEPGIYPPLVFLAGTAPAAIRSADARNPARLRGLVLRDAHNVTISTVVLDYVFVEGDDLRTRPFSIRDSSNITIRDAEIIGDVARGLGPAADGFGSGIGVSVRDSQNVRLEHVRIAKFHRGIVVAQTQRFVIKDSEITNIRSDGMNFAEVSEVLIEGNKVFNFNRSLASTDHADLIQFWTTRTENPAANITIRSNVLLSGDSAWSHSIFMRNELVDTGNAGSEMFYRNILIEENVIINAHLHGISVGEAQDVVIRRNTLAQNKLSAGGAPSRGLWNPMIQVSSRALNVSIIQNAAFQIHGYVGQPDWSVRDNLLIQNSSLLQPNHYNRIFTGFPDGDPRDIQSYFYVPVGPLGRSNIGAPMMRRN